MIYVRLKSLRKAHGLKQNDVADWLGLGQTVVSRMESRHAELDEIQYNTLCEKLGKDEVDKYVGEPPWTNAVSKSTNIVVRNVKPTEKLSPEQEVSALIRVIYEQQAEIDNLKKEIERLKTK